MRVPRRSGTASSTSPRTSGSSCCSPGLGQADRRGTRPLPEGDRQRCRARPCCPVGGRPVRFRGVEGGLRRRPTDGPRICTKPLTSGHATRRSDSRSFTNIAAGVGYGTDLGEVPVDTRPAPRHRCRAGEPRPAVFTLGRRRRPVRSRCGRTPAGGSGRASVGVLRRCPDPPADGAVDRTRTAACTSQSSTPPVAAAPSARRGGLSSASVLAPSATTTITQGECRETRSRSAEHVLNT